MSAPPIHFRVVLSIPQWTPESIGWTIKGITPRPTAVVIHLRVVKGSFGATFASENREPAQILLIVNPEIKALLERGRAKNKTLGRNY